MKRTRTKWDDPAEDEVLLKLYRSERLTRKDHFTLEKMYRIHGASSVYMAMGNLSGKLLHISKRLAQAAKKTPYMQTTKADVTLQFTGPREQRLELTMSLPRKMGLILVRRLGKRISR